MLRKFLQRFRGRGPEPEIMREPAKDGWALQMLLAEEGAAAPPPEDGPAPEPDDFPPASFSLLAVVNRTGSVEHYYHFILGYVAPLLLRDAEVPPGHTVLTRSCGPLDTMFAELALPDVRQVHKADWRARRESGRYKTQTITGHDWPEDYDPSALAKLRERMLARLGLEPPAAATAPVLLVNRGRSPEAYQAQGAENPTSANLRRSVPNMADVRSALLAGGTACELVELEATTLRAQVALFAGTRTLVAQHGAALVNMVWMTPGGVILEIQPDMGRATRIFRMLAAACGHSYVALKQAEHHAPVDVAEVAEAVRSHGVGLRAPDGSRRD